MNGGGHSLPRMDLANFFQPDEPGSCTFTRRSDETFLIVCSRLGSGNAPGRRALTNDTASVYGIPLTQHR